MPTHTLANGSSIEYVELEQEPRHHVLFENSRVRCYDVLVKPGDTTLFHRHINDTFYALVAGGHGAMQRAGDSFKDNVHVNHGTTSLMCRSRPIGQLARDLIHHQGHSTVLVHNADVLSTRNDELIHRVHFKEENKNTFHILGVELLPSESHTASTAAPPPDQSALIKSGYTPVTEHVWPQISVHKLTLPPGQSTGDHTYGSLSGVALFLTGGYLRVLEGEGSSPSPFSGGFVSAGSIKWHEGGVKHDIVNIGETELVAMLVHLV